MTPDLSEPDRKPFKKRLLSWIGFVLGIGLLAGAAWFVYRGADELQDPIETLKDAPLSLIVLALLFPIANVFAVSLCFHALMNRGGRVKLSEMTALISSAWLLNHLPMRPGLIGRISYHKAINKISIRYSVAATFWSVGGAVAANAALLVWALWMPGFDAPSFSSLGAAYGLVPTLAFFVIAMGAPSEARLLVLSFAYRSLDVWVWYMRYALAFRLLGADLSPSELAVISAASQLATLVPLTGSGVGFREWGVGLSTTLSGAAATLGIAADLINRAAETIVVVPIGLVSSMIVAKRWKRVRAELASSEPDAFRSPEDETHKQPEQDRETGDHPEQDPADP